MALEAPLSADMLQQMLEHAPQVMVVVSVPELRVTYANRAARHVLAGDLSGDLVGARLGDAVPFLDPAMAEAAARSGQPQSASPAAPIAGPGATWWDVSCVPLPSAVLVTAVDVTAHERAKAEAQGAHDMLDAILAHIPEGISISQGPDVRVALVSAQGVALAGRARDDLTGRSALYSSEWWEVYRPGSDEQLPPEDRPMARATRTGAVTTNETLLLRRPDGSKVPVLCNAGPIRDAEGRITGAILAWRDISELQRAQDAQRHSEELLRQVLLQIPAAVFVVEAPDGRMAFKSRLVDDVLGHPDTDLSRARASMQSWAMHPDGTAYALEEYPSRRALFKGETVHAEPMIYLRGDGRGIELEMHAGPIRNDAGEIVAAVAAAFDVTERNLAASQLHESEERLRVALEAGGLGTWEIDPVDGTTRIGRSLAVMLGLPAQPVVWERSAAMALIHPDDRERVAAMFASAVAEGDDYVNEFRAGRADGSTRWFTSHGRIIRASDGTPLRAVGVVRDVTDRRMREEHLREALESRELLLREADHRIKNSLQLVGSLLGLQRARLSDPDAVAALDGAMTRVMAVSEAHRALHQSIDLRHVVLDQMLRDLCSHVGALMPAVAFVCECPPDIELDTERAIPLGLVVSELLTNAAKHAYPSASGAVRTTAGIVDGRFEIVVEDTGVGMAAPRAGLGSTIVRSLAAQIGATLDVMSAPGQGTQARLTFPRRESAAAG
jgi:PAS domain S-box-containing protein